MNPGTIKEIDDKDKLEIVFENLEKENDYVTDRMDLVNCLEPHIPSSNPYRLHLEKGKFYFYCTCGLSKMQPFCDGSHKSTNFKPLKFAIKQDVKWTLLCGCKRNDITSGPYCDGSHANIDW